MVTQPVGRIQKTSALVSTFIWAWIWCCLPYECEEPSSSSIFRITHWRQRSKPIVWLAISLQRLINTVIFSESQPRAVMPWVGWIPGVNDGWKHKRLHWRDRGNCIHGSTDRPTCTGMRMKNYGKVYHRKTEIHYLLRDADASQDELICFLDLLQRTHGPNINIRRLLSKRNARIAAKAYQPYGASPPCGCTPRRKANIQYHA